jgi:hypothetical protein
VPSDRVASAVRDDEIPPIAGQGNAVRNWDDRINGNSDDPFGITFAQTRPAVGAVQHDVPAGREEGQLD